MLKLKVIACDVLNREISYLASRSKCFIDVTFLRQGLHDTPDKLGKELQAEIDKANSGFPYNHFNTAPDYDYIIVGYGLCGNGIVGVSSSKLPMVIPRGHDCITMLLGSKELFAKYFDEYPGTYWFSSGWIERAWQPSKKRYEAAYKKYLEKYGEENAEYLMEMEQSWLRDYKRAGLISWECLDNYSHYCEFTRESARFLNWDYKEFNGSSSMLERMLNGIFEEKEVLVVPPGKKVVPSFKEDIIKIE